MALVSARIRHPRFVVPMPPEHWQLAMAEHEAIMNALQRRDATVLSSILKTHLRHKREQVEKAGFAERDDTPPLPHRAAPKWWRTAQPCCRVPRTLPATWPAMLL
jgi:hypothetical protein